MDEQAVDRTNAACAVADALPADASVDRTVPIDAGTNDVFRVETCVGDRVVKFNTYSEFATMAAEVEIYRLLADTDVPVPGVVDADLDSDPAYFVMEALSGAPPTEARPALAEQMGETLRAFASVPDVEGYGRLHHEPDAPHSLAASADTWREYVEWYVDHILSRYCDRFADLVDPVRDVVVDRLDAVPREPDPAVAYHDFRPANVHVADGEIVGVVDIERADLGDIRYTLVETEYLLTRHRPDRADRLRRALYAGFGTDPDERVRTCYRALAVAREIRGFDAWWDDGADEKAANVRRIAEEVADASND